MVLDELLEALKSYRELEERRVATKAEQDSAQRVAQQVALWGPS